MKIAGNRWKSAAPAFSRSQRDSNPRAVYTTNTLAGCPYRPLRHDSTLRNEAQQQNIVPCPADTTCRMRPKNARRPWRPGSPSLALGQGRITGKGDDHGTDHQCDANNLTGVWNLAKRQSHSHGHRGVD